MQGNLPHRSPQVRPGSKTCCPGQTRWRGARLHRCFSTLLSKLAATAQARCRSCLNGQRRGFAGIAPLQADRMTEDSGGTPLLRATDATGTGTRGRMPTHFNCRRSGEDSTAPDRWPVVPAARRYAHHSHPEAASRSDWGNEARHASSRSRTSGCVPRFWRPTDYPLRPASPSASKT